MSADAKPRLSEKEQQGYNDFIAVTDLKPFVREGDVARVLGVSRQTVKNLTAFRDFPPGRIIGGVRLRSALEIFRWMQSQPTDPSLVDHAPYLEQIAVRKKKRDEELKPFAEYIGKNKRKQAARS